MSDQATPQTGTTPTAQPVAPQATSPSQPPAAEWKPEPRQWSWKDLFTAPMLAFKPKCMLISACTVVAVALWWMLFTHPIGEGKSLQQALAIDSDSRFWLHLVTWIWAAVSLVIFSLGATLVAVFLKADLLDDEFLSWSEAFQQYRSRVLPAVLVPLFLLALVTGVWLAIWGGLAFCSIPYFGPVLYAIPVTYLLAFAAALAGVLLFFACILGIYLMPGVIAVRRHGWFDNVVDTIEAVGTKPHQLVLAGAISLLVMLLAYLAGSWAIGSLNTIATGCLPGKENQLAKVEEIAAIYRGRWTAAIDPASYLCRPSPQAFARDLDFTLNDRLIDFSDGYKASRAEGFEKWTGMTVAAWQTLIIALLVGYCLNLLLSGGLLAYLWVREDDYWDEEDLQDLDKLAKELEEEAKREDGKTAATMPPA